MRIVREEAKYSGNNNVSKDSGNNKKIDEFDEYMQPKKKISVPE